MKFEFKSKYSMEERIEKSNKIRQKWPDRVPVIVERNTKSSPSLPNIAKTKYLVPVDITLDIMHMTIRKQLKIDETEAIYLFVNHNTLLSLGSLTMGTIYENHKDKDGFLYLTYTSENTYG